MQPTMGMTMLISELSSNCLVDPTAYVLTQKQRHEKIPGKWHHSKLK
jgi:hypothetical protein